jgi:hypothetical protein
MSVYNRKMFRKKGGGAAGIMASGPELIKAQQGAFMGPGIPMSGVRNFSPAALGSTRIDNQSVNPLSGFPGFIKDAFTSSNPSALGQVINYSLKGLDAKKRAEEEDKSEEANKAAKDKIITPFTQGAIEAATGAEPDIEAKDPPGVISDTIASLKLFKKNITPTIEEFKKNYTDLPREVFNLGVDKLTSFLKKKTDETSFLDAAGENQGAIGSVAAKKNLYELEKESRIEQGFLPAPGGEKTKKEGEIVIVGGKEKLKTTDTNGNEIITDLTEKKKKEVSLSESAKNLGDSEYDKKQLATTEETGQGSKANQTVALLDSNSEKSAKDGLTNTSTLEKLFRDKLAVLSDDKTKSNIGDILGIQSFDQMTLGERTAAYKSILKATLGEDKDIKDDASFNLIMTGLLIASGDSPDALTNIARGFANGLKMYADNISDKRKEKREIALAATKLAITADESAKERTFKAEQNRLDRISKEFIATAKGKTSKSKLREAIYKKLIANPDGYLGLRDKLTYAKLPESQKAVYLNQITNKLTDTFFNVEDQNVQVPYYETLEGPEREKALREMSVLNNKAIDDGKSSYTYNNQTFQVTDKKFNFDSK